MKKKFLNYIDIRMYYNKELFKWLLNLLEKYSNGDNIEIVTIIFMNAYRKNWNKNIVYQKLVKHIDPSPKLVEKLYSRFDELKREAHNI